MRHFFIDPLLAFVNKFRAKLHKTGASDFDISPEKMDSVATTFLRSWKSVKDLADQNHADFIGVLQPTIYRGNPRTDQLEVDKSLQSVYLAFYTTVFKKLKEPEFTGLSDCVLDLENVFDGEELIYIDDVHVSPNGNRIAANKIYNFILDLRQKKINNNHGMVN